VRDGKVSRLEVPRSQSNRKCPRPLGTMAQNRNKPPLRPPARPNIPKSPSLFAHRQSGAQWPLVAGRRATHGSSCAIPTTDFGIGLGISWGPVDELRSGVLTPPGRAMEATLWRLQNACAC